MLFHKDGGENFSHKLHVTISMFVTTKAIVKLANENTGHAKIIGIVLCHFTNSSIIYPVGLVYYFPGHPYNTISSGSLKCYVFFQRLHLNPLNILTLFTLEVIIGYHYAVLKTIPTIFKSKKFKVNPQRDRNILVLTLCSLKKKSLSDYSSYFFHVYMIRLK